MPWRTSPWPGVLVAESLRRLPEPPFAPAPPLGPAPREVAAAIARSLSPALAADAPPAWLRPAQRHTFARALFALRRFGGALIADPVGSGKSWIALAIARAESDDGAVVIAPAVLCDQWRRVAARVDVEVVVQSHEQWSRRPPTLPPGLVVVDESHRFRHPDIRRYRALAPALLGRSGLLLTATPAVNHLGDVAHQLLLFARDDCLAGSGIPSLLDTLLSGVTSPPLANLIVAGAEAPGRPREVERVIPAGDAEDAEAEEALRHLDRMRLSPSRSVRSLIAGVLATALASSRAALHTALQRYRSLLLQSGDASAAGIRLGRRELSRLLGADASQIQLWSLFDLEGVGTDLLQGDLPALEEWITWLRERKREPEPKVARLAALLADGDPSVVFTGSRATADALRRALQPPSRIAWISGAGGGIGAVRLRPVEVLGWFGPRAAEHPLAPRVLVATDVAAEGLDLQRARRVVHFDLPWTAVRLDQRAGRAVRLGSRHAGVEVVTLLPPAAVERRLQVLARLARKRPLPSRLGVGPCPEPVWRWLATLYQRFGDTPPAKGAVILAGDCDAALVGVEFRAGEEVVSALALARRGGPAWSDDHTLVDFVLRLAAAGEPAPEDPALVARALASASGHVRTALLGASGGLWRIRPLAGESRMALRGVQAFAADAIRRRDRSALALADRGIAFLRRGHTAGERHLAARLADTAGEGLGSVLAELPRPDALPLPVRATIVGVVLVRGG